MHKLLDGVAEGLPATARSAIVARAEGIPLYAIETLRALADRGVLTQSTTGTWVVTGDVEDIDVPASLSSLLAARLDALTPHEREVVKAMAVFGGTFPRDTAAALSEIPPEAVDDGLAGLVRKRVLTIRTDPLSPDRGQYGFAQQLLRTVAYDMLSRAERKPGHRAAAEHLRQAFPQDGEDVSEVIASHYLEAFRAAAGDADAGELRAEALKTSRRAARRAETVGAPALAEKAYRTALELVGDDEVERVALLEAAGTMANYAGRYEPAVELLESAAREHGRAGRERDAARVAGRIGGTLRLLGRSEEAIDRLRSALATLGADDLDPEVAALNLELGTALVFVGRPEEATGSLERALIAAEALQLWEILCVALSSTGVCCGFASRFEQECGLYRTAIAIAERYGVRTTVVAESNLAESLVSGDEPDGAQVCETAFAAARRRGFRRAEGMSAGNLLYAWLLAGRWDRVDEFGREVLGQFGDVAADACFVQVRLATLASYRGDFGRAGSLLEHAAPYWAAQARVDLASWLIGQGRSAEASAPLDQAIATLASLGAAPALARVRTLATAGGPAAPAASAPS